MIRAGWDERLTRIAKCSERGRYVVARMDIGGVMRCLLEETPSILVPDSNGSSEEACCIAIRHHPRLSAHLCATATATHPEASSSRELRQLYANSFHHHFGGSAGGFIALYEHASLMNHSCVPNVVLQSELAGEEEEKVGKGGAAAAAGDGSGRGPRIVSRVLTLVPIRAGEPICISYQPSLLAPTPVRRLALEQRYGFRCCCPRCARFETAPGDEAMLAACYDDGDARLDLVAHRRAAAIARSDAFREHVVLLSSTPREVLRTRTFQVLWGTAIVARPIGVGVAGRRGEGEDGDQDALTVSYPAWPATHHIVCQLRNVLLRAVTDDEDGECVAFAQRMGLDSGCIRMLAQHQLEVTRRYYGPPWFMPGPDLDAVLAALVPEFTQLQLLLTFGKN